MLGTLTSEIMQSVENNLSDTLHSMVQDAFFKTQNTTDNTSYCFS